VIVTGSSNWHAGVVGLIAARLKERFQRPAIAIAFLPNGVGSGSGRSIPGVDLGHAIRAAVDRGILLKGGGHAMAAGLTVDAGRLGDLRAFLDANLGSAVHAFEDGGLAVDAAVGARGATIELIETMERAGPFGAGHPDPVIALPSHRIAYADLVGNGHVRVTLAGADNATIKAMAFRAAGSELGQTLLASRGRLVHAAGTLSIDQWQERRQPAMRLVDIAEAK
jgi:single-stranded-DNA-specific exonuclease